MRTETTTLYQFDELSDDAKEKARYWYRSGALDYEWWDAVYDDAVQCAALLGIDVATRGDRRTQPAIFFSGFNSQGDGACFDGMLSWKACSKAIRDHAPKDATLHAIADTFVGFLWSLRQGFTCLRENGLILYNGDN